MTKAAIVLGVSKVFIYKVSLLIITGEYHLNIGI